MADQASNSSQPSPLLKQDALAWMADALEQLDGRHLRRRLQARSSALGPEIEVDGQRLINFASNDYLSLAADARLVDAACQAARSEGWGSGASPLIIGRGAAHAELEARLAAMEDAEAALLFSTGFAANSGAIAALVERGDAIFADQLNHASLIDGCRLSRAEVYVYPHGDLHRLEELLQQAGGYRRRLIVSDTLFSMDGDLADLSSLVSLAERYDSMLLVDEAHATGVLGASGRGAAEQFGVERRIDVRIGTLSKALGSAGGFVAGRQVLIDWLLNRARPYVFSTCMPAALAAAGLAALDIVRDEPQRRAQLIARAAELRERLIQAGWDVGASASQIIPLMIGRPERAVQLSQRLRERGLLVPAIRPPSVPDGQSRLRISLCWGHSEEMVEQLLAALASER